MLPGIYLGKLLGESRPDLDLRFHATTRSPIGTANLPDYPVQSGWQIPSFYEAGRKTYIYNLKAYDIAIIISDSYADCRESAAEQFAALLHEQGVKDVYFCKGKRHREEAVLS